MSLHARFERSLALQFEAAIGHGSPQRLVDAMRHAVFSPGAHIRPQLCLAVATACGDDEPGMADAAAVAIELMHCASLVHDDMPAFDNAATRRGRPSVHAAFGEPLALLTGDALIVLAYQVLMRAGRRSPARLVALLDNLNAGVGVPGGIVAGQAWECEARAELAQYQRAKTGALFVAAVRAGALACGTDARPWTAMGTFLGEAYQVADDIRDVLGQVEQLGKPIGQDTLHDRPSSARALGLEGALQHFEQLVAATLTAIPACACRELLVRLVQRESERLVPLASRAMRPEHQVSPEAL